MTIATEITRNNGATLVPVEELQPSEQINPQRASSLALQISRHGIWKRPLLVQRENMIVMDGHHRLDAARALGLKWVPCCLLSYEDPRVTVTSWCDAAPFDASRVVNAGLTGQLLGFKSTRHRVSSELPCCAIPLGALV